MNVHQDYCQNCTRTSLCREHQILRYKREKANSCIECGNKRTMRGYYLCGLCKHIHGIDLDDCTLYDTKQTAREREQEAYEAQMDNDYWASWEVSEARAAMRGNR